MCNNERKPQHFQETVGLDLTLPSRLCCLVGKLIPSDRKDLLHRAQTASGARFCVGTKERNYAELVCTNPLIS